MSNSYVVRTIADMLNIPADRREAAFTEFLGMLAEGDRDPTVAAKIRGVAHFTWVDNGDPALIFRQRYVAETADGKIVPVATVDTPHEFSGHGDDITRVS